MDPASAAALVALLSQGGPWAVVVVVLGVVLRAWRGGEFISKPTHDQIVTATTQRYLDLLDRFNNQQAAIDKWREQAERAATAAEQSQTQHGQVLAAVAALGREVGELRDDLRDHGLPGGNRSPARRGPGAREGA